MKRTVLVLAVLTAVAGASAAACSKKDEAPPAPPGASKVSTEVTTKSPSGLGYAVLLAPKADAPIAKSGQTVSVHYTGWLTDGKQFDSSTGQEPISFTLGAHRVIQGWDEGITGMAKGEKRRLVIPPTLGYGARGAGSDIPPNATLVFEVELVDVK